MRAIHHPRRERAQLVTQAHPSLSADISYRERRYLIMMGIRLACFVIAVVVFINGAGWLTAIPAVGAIIIPYFAVIFANGGREPGNSRGFQEYRPNVPERFSGPPGGRGGPAPHADAGPRDSGTSGNSGEPGWPGRSG